MNIAADPRPAAALACTTLYRLLRPLLFALDAEQVHELTLAGLQQGHRLGVTRPLLVPLGGEPVRVMGVDFPNPVGLAAGLDKNGAHIDALGAMGFGFIEVGTVTPRPQPGNPKPRLFRLEQAEALINRLGFNNQGVERCVANVRGARYAGVLGLNIGKNAATGLAEAAQDYLHCLAAVYPYAGYVTINISSPNTQGLRLLQGRGELEHLLGALTAARERLSQQHGRRVPLAVKVAPDLDDADLLRLADSLCAYGIDGVIATNTTIARAAVAGLAHANQPGGLSGRPLRERATAVVHRLASHLQGALPIIAVGGIMEAADALEKIAAGASLVQLYSGLIYRGPGLVVQCRQALAARAGRAAAGAVAV